LDAVTTSPRSFLPAFRDASPNEAIFILVGKDAVNGVRILLAALDIKEIL
jgi:hypothetical protein